MNLRNIYPCLTGAHPCIPALPADTMDSPVTPEIKLPQYGAVSSSRYMRDNINNTAQVIEQLLIESDTQRRDVHLRLLASAALERLALRRIKSLQQRAETLAALMSYYTATGITLYALHEGFDDLSRVSTQSKNIMVGHSRLALQPSSLQLMELVDAIPNLNTAGLPYEEIPGASYTNLCDRDETTAWGMTVKSNGPSQLQFTLNFRMPERPIVLILDGDFGLGASLLVEGWIDDAFAALSKQNALTDHNRIALWTEAPIVQMRLTFSKPSPDYKNEHYYLIRHLAFFAGNYRKQGVYISKALPIIPNDYRPAGPLTVLIDPNYALPEGCRIRMYLAEDPYTPGTFEDAENNKISPDSPDVDHYNPDAEEEYTRASVLREYAAITGVPEYYADWEPGNWRYPLDLDADVSVDPDDEAWIDPPLYWYGLAAIYTLEDGANQLIDLTWGVDCMEYFAGTLTRHLSQPAIVEQTDGEYYAYFPGSWGYNSMLAIYDSFLDQKTVNVDYTVVSNPDNNETLAINTIGVDSTGWFAEFTLQTNAYWTFSIKVQEYTAIIIADPENRLTYIDILLANVERREYLLNNPDNTQYVIDLQPGEYQVFLYTKDRDRWDPETNENDTIRLTGIHEIIARNALMRHVPYTSLLSVSNPNFHGWFSIVGDQVVVRIPNQITGRLYNITGEYSAMIGLDYDKFFGLRIYNRVNATDHVLVKFELYGGEMTPEIYGYNLLARRAGSDDYLQPAGAGAVGFTIRAAASANPRIT